MSLARLFVEHAVVFGWVLARVAGFVAVTPFPSAEVPTTARVSLALAVAWVVSGYAAPTTPLPAMDLTLVLTAGSELGAGLAMGFVFRLLFSAADTAGDIVAHAIGLQSGAVFSPATGQNDPTLARVVSLAAMSLVVGLGAHRIALAHVLESFRALPLGASVSVADAGPALATLSANVLIVAVRLALPVVAVCLLTQLALALIARSAPSMQLFSVGLAVTLGGGLVTLLGAARGLGAGIARLVGTLPVAVDRIFHAMGAGG